MVEGMAELKIKIDVEEEGGAQVPALVAAAVRAIALLRILPHVVIPNPLMAVARIVGGGQEGGVLVKQ